MKYLLIVGGMLSLAGTIAIAVAGIAIASFLASGIFGTGTWAHTNLIERSYSVLAVLLGLAPSIIWIKNLFAILNGKPIGPIWKALTYLFAVAIIVGLLHFPHGKSGIDTFSIVFGLIVSGFAIGQPMMLWAHGHRLKNSASHL